MKSLYWNARGLANAPTRLALKRLLAVHKPEFCFIAEPWMSFDDLPRGWLNRLGYKLFASNFRDNLLPNLWCLCLINLNPTTVETSDQLVAFTFYNNNELFGITAIYASNCHVKRRLLWRDLQALQSNNQIPWCFMGDFNVILGTHEYRGNFIPDKVPIEDFQNWTNTNNLIHLPTRGAAFTWRNGREGYRYTEKRLDRCVCNHSWIDLFSSVSCSTLIRNRSDHHPIIMEFIINPHQFKSQFMKMWSLHDDCKNIVSNSWNTHIVGCPMLVLSKKLQILKSNLKMWNKTVFGNVHQLVSQAESNLQNIQNQIQTNGHTDTLIQQEKKAQGDLDLALNKEETFWFEKSKVKWHMEGDRNTAYFHRVTKIKKYNKADHTPQRWRAHTH